jgi:hypothetical protein
MALDTDLEYGQRVGICHGDRHAPGVNVPKFRRLISQQVGEEPGGRAADLWKTRQIRFQQLPLGTVVVIDPKSIARQ